jgi:hypothetical protein
MTRTYRISLAATALSLIALSFLARTRAVPAAADTRVAVIVELFTSEGCSTCPPADALLTRLEAEQPVKNAEIIALEEHVDYWNTPAWMDPFSSSSATYRQYNYAGVLKNGNPYTPQMVVDGETEFVGNREAQARGAIEQAAAKAKVNVTIAAGSRASDGAAEFKISVATLPAGSAANDAPEVWLAVTETGLHSSVNGGENSGQNVHHAAVVRRLVKLGTAAQTGEFAFSRDERVKFDKSWKRENTRVVVFVQEKKSKKILGAASARVAAS